MTNLIQIRLLGTPTVQCDDRSVKLGAGAQALLYYLAATQQPQRRSVLAGLLWGETEEELARTSLRRTLSDMRKVLGDRFVSDYQSVTLSSGACWIDLVEFQQAENHTTPLALPRLQAALELYQGDFLCGFFLRNAPEFEHWLLSQRTYYRELALSGWQTLATRYAQQGELEQAVYAARRGLMVEPWHEEAHQSIMRWLAQSGQRSAALAQYELCRRQLADELEVEPSGETVALYEEIRTGKFDRRTRGRDEQGIDDALTENSPKRRASDAAVLWAQSDVILSSDPLVIQSSPHHNLPPQPTLFVGRQQELNDVVQRLADPACRLLTLAGPGGIGKTRLAIEAAKASAECEVRSAEYRALSASHIPQFPDGIYFVSLAAVNTPRMISAAIAEVVGLTFYATGPAHQQLLRHLADKQLLLVLDNFEHLLAGVDLIGELLNAAPRVKLLVTSREVLNLHEEWLYPLSGLTLPAVEVAANLRDLTVDTPAMADADAVQLFVQCAQRVRPTFALAVEWCCVLRICRLVEGMPLAIELATAWLKALSCAEIAEEIEHNLDFLTTRLQNIPLRHRSMRAVFEHSWQLLAIEEQRMMRQLAIFRGGFTREAAHAVVGAPLPLLAVLVAKSLVRRTDSGRYELHELVRQYCAEKMTEEGQAEPLAVKQQHLEFYLQLAETFEAQFSTANLLVWLARVEQERHNFRIALEFAITANPEKALRLIVALHDYWFQSATLEGRNWMHQALAVAQAKATSISVAVRVQVLLKATHLLEDPPQNEALARAALTLAQTIQDETLIAEALRSIAANIWQHGRMAEAVPLFEESICRFTVLGQQDELYDALSIYANALRYHGAYAQARILLDQSLQVAHSLGSPVMSAHALYGLGILALYRGALQQAQALLAESLLGFQAVGIKRGIAMVLRWQGQVAGYQGDYARSAQYLQASIMRWEEIAFPGGAAATLTCLAELFYWQGKLAEAAECLSRVQRSLPQGEQLAALVYLVKGNLARTQQAYGPADECLAESLRLVTMRGERWRQIAIWHAQGLLYLAQQKRSAARMAFTQCLTAAQRIGDQMNIARGLEGLAAVALQHGETQRGGQLFGAAAALRAAIDAPLPPIERNEYAALWATTCASTSQVAFDQMWAAGRLLPIEQAIALAHVE